MPNRRDFFVVAETCGVRPEQWRWQIYRAGRKTPIFQSVELFVTATMASRAGDNALKLMLSECPKG